jgi:hypothetical protein
VDCQHKINIKEKKKDVDKLVSPCYLMDMSEQRIKIGETIPIPEKGKRQFQPTVKEYILDEWRAMGFNGVDMFREGIRLVFEPVNKKEAP